MAAQSSDRTEYEILNPTQMPSNAASVDVKHYPQRGQQPTRPYWRADTAMAISLLVGIAFGLIHHFFYWYWDGRAVASDSQQRWIIRGGTAFAFAVKTSLAFGTSVAYIQYFWLSLTSKSFKVANVNSMFGVLNNVTELLDLKLWTRVPLLALPAIVTWTLPLAAIVTPGTLIVNASLRNRTELLGVPQFDYRNYTNFASPLPVDNTAFDGASNDLIRIAFGCATTGSILTITPPTPNSTYSLNFSAPALSCEIAPANDSVALQEQFYNWTGSSGGPGLDYFSWAPTPTDGSQEGWENGCGNGSAATPPPFNTTANFATIDQCSYGWYDGYAGEHGWSAKLNVFVPRYQFINSPNPDYQEYDPSIFLNCSLNNASYTVGFDFRDSTQILEVKNKSSVNGVPFFDGLDDTFTLGNASAGRVLLASEVAAYISVMDAFGRLMAGAVETYHYGTVTPYSTLVLSTSLNSLLTTADNATLAQVIEQLFENITLSLLSSSLYTVNFTNTTNKALFDPTPVTIYYPQNIYAYQPLDLWLAYGIALLFYVLCLLIGIIGLRQNGFSYSNNFTTILRTTRNPNLDLLVTESESSGADPVPSHTMDGTLTYRRSNAYGWAGFSIRGMQ